MIYCNPPWLRPPYRDVEIPSQEKLEEACQGTLHPMALKGMHLFDAGDYWHAHEALEEAWLAEEAQLAPSTSAFYRLA